VSTQDGTGPAANNPSLNGIADGDSSTVEIDFPGSITGIAAYNPLSGASAMFSDGSIAETSFGTHARELLRVTEDERKAA